MREKRGGNGNASLLRLQLRRGVVAVYQGGRKEQTSNGNEAGPDASEWTLLCPFKVLLFVLCTIKVLFFFLPKEGCARRSFTCHLCNCYPSIFTRGQMLRRVFFFSHLHLNGGALVPREGFVNLFFVLISLKTGGCWLTVLRPVGPESPFA